MPTPIKTAGPSRPRKRGQKSTTVAQAIPRPPKLDEPGKFVVRRRVPILDVHDHPTKGKVDRRLLRVLAYNSNRRADQGNYALTILGHTTDDGHETDQPPLVGFHKNFVVGEFRGKPCLLADFYFRPDRFSTAMEFPHRSVERVESSDIKSNYIDATALLKRAPERPLSLLTYSRGRSPGTRVVRYSCEDLPPIGSGGGRSGRPVKESKMADTLMGTLDPAASAGLEALIEKVMLKVLASMVDGPTMTEPTVPPMADAEPGDEPDLSAEPDLSPEEDGLDELDDMDGLGDDDLGDGPPSDGDMDSDLDGIEDEDEDDLPKVQKHSLASPSANGGYVPSHATGKPKKPEVSRMSREATPVRYRKVIERQEQEIAALREQVKTEKVRYARESQRRSELSKLAEDGFDLDVDEELKEFANSSDARFAKHLEKVKTRYARIPLGREVLPTRSPVEDPEDTYETQTAMVKYGRDNNIEDRSELVRRFMAENLDQYKAPGQPKSSR